MRHLVKATVAPLVVASVALLVASTPPAAAIPPKALTKKAAPAAAAPAAAKPAKALLGMSAPQSTWAQRVKEVGPGLESRRVFVLSFTGSLGVATAACNAGLFPVISFDTGSYSWAQVANGNADAALRALATKLDALPCNVFASIAHEPWNKGTAADWSRMQAHALPLLGAPASVKVGVIANGWWWSSTTKRLTDAQIATWIPRSVINVSDVIASDVYQAIATGEDPAIKIKNFAAWARRVGGVKALGLGEFNAATAKGITSTTTALGGDSLFAWGCLWNANGNSAANATVLSGDRLAAFKKALAAW
jgi:hypothetical protein